MHKIDCQVILRWIVFAVKTQKSGAGSGLFDENSGKCAREREREREREKINVDGPCVESRCNGLIEPARSIDRRRRRLPVFSFISYQNAREKGIFRLKITERRGKKRTRRSASASTATPDNEGVIKRERERERETYPTRPARLRCECSAHIERCVQYKIITWPK